MKRIAISVASAVIATGALTACGGDSGYCDSIKDFDKDFGKISQTDATSADFKKATQAIDDIAGQSPDSVKKEWKTLGSKLGAVNKALDDAGLKVEDLRDQQKMRKVDKAKIAEVTKAAQGMGEANAAQVKITKQVKKECNITLK